MTDEVAAVVDEVEDLLLGAKSSRETPQGGEGRLPVGIVSVGTVDIVLRFGVAASDAVRSVAELLRGIHVRKVELQFYASPLELDDLELPGSSVLAPPVALLGATAVASPRSRLLLSLTSSDTLGISFRCEGVGEVGVPVVLVLALGIGPLESFDLGVLEGPYGANSSSMERWKSALMTRWSAKRSGEVHALQGPRHAGGIPSRLRDELGQL